MIERVPIGRAAAATGAVERAAPWRPPEILLVSARREDHAWIREFLPAGGCKLHIAQSYQEAVRTLCRVRVSVVICDSELPDGSWMDILGQTAPLSEAPRVIVAAAQPEIGLRSRVLAFGGFDLIASPLERHEMERAVGKAWREWQEEWLSHPQYAVPMTA